MLPIRRPSSLLSPLSCLILDSSFAFPTWTVNIPRQRGLKYKVLNALQFYCGSQSADDGEHSLTYTLFTPSTHCTLNTLQRHGASFISIKKHTYYRTNIFFKPTITIMPHHLPMSHTRSHEKHRDPSCIPRPSNTFIVFLPRHQRQKIFRQLSKGITVHPPKSSVHSSPFILFHLVLITMLTQRPFFEETLT